MWAKSPSTNFSTAKSLEACVRAGQSSGCTLAAACDGDGEDGVGDAAGDAAGNATDMPPSRQIDRVKLEIINTL